MANKLFSFFKQGNDNYEVKDAQARTDIDTINNTLASILDWKVVGTTVGAEAQALPSSFKEIMVCFQFANSKFLTFSIPNAMLPLSGSIEIRNGYYLNEGANCAIVLSTSKTSIVPTSAIANNNNILSGVVISYYYR